MFFRAFRSLSVVALSAVVAPWSSAEVSQGEDIHHEIIISVRDQQLLLKTDGRNEKTYPVSTSKYGIGDRFGSYATPLGRFLVKVKIGMGRPLGTVFRSRVPTGEVLKPNAPGRDPIVTRILWLEGTESCNRNAFARGIYIHGTPQESLIGRPASFGCIRMRSADVAALCEKVTTGAKVTIVPDHLTPRPGLLGFSNPHALLVANSKDEGEDEHRDRE